MAFTRGFFSLLQGGARSAGQLGEPCNESTLMHWCVWAHTQTQGKLFVTGSFSGRCARSCQQGANRRGCILRTEILLLLKNTRVFAVEGAGHADVQEELGDVLSVHIHRQLPLRVVAWGVGSVAGFPISVIFPVVLLIG